MVNSSPANSYPFNELFLPNLLDAKAPNYYTHFIHQPDRHRSNINMVLCTTPLPLVSGIKTKNFE